MANEWSEVLREKEEDDIVKRKNYQSLAKCLIEVESWMSINIQLGNLKP